MSAAPQTPTATQLLDAQYLEMRWRILSLAADLDRIHRAPGGAPALASPKLTELLDCLYILTAPTPHPDRAERVQHHLSDPAGDPRES